MSNGETQVVESSDARSVIEEFLTAVHVEAALFLDFESRLTEAAKLNSTIVPALNQFNQALKDPQTRSVMEWLFRATDLQAGVSALLQEFGVQKARIS